MTNAVAQITITAIDVSRFMRIGDSTFGAWAIGDFGTGGKIFKFTNITDIAYQINNWRL